MITAGVPGTYIFHSGEEVGGVGSEHIAETMVLTKFKRAIEFDRRGKSSVIISMGWTDTCSLEFAEAHSAQEIIDADWLITGLIPRLYKIDWKALPIKRDPAQMYKWDAGIYGGYSGTSFP
jgi:hypothetical protein